MNLPQEEPTLSTLDPRRPMWRLVLWLAWPALLQQWLVLAVTLSDRLLAGRFQSLDAEALVATQSAQTTASYLAWFLSSYAVLVSVGSTTLVAQFTGNRDRPGTLLLLHQALILGLALGILGAAAGLIFVRPILIALALEGQAVDFAAGYLQPLLWALPPQLVGMAGIACLVGAGDTRTGLWVLGAVAVVNVGLAWVFFQWLGFVGIAVGTAVAEALGGVAVVGVLWHGRAGLKINPHLLWPRWDLLQRLLRVSVPAGFDAISMAIGQLWFLGIVNGLGDVAAAAHGIALGWEAMAYQSGVAFGTAAVALVGQCQGAQQPQRASRAGWTAFGLGVGVMCFMGSIFFALAPLMFELFSDQEAIVREGVPVLRLVACSMPALASCLILGWALRGAGDTRVPMLFTWVGFFVIRIPLAYWLTDGPLGLFGAWLAMGADLHVRGLFVLLRFASGRWRTIKV